MNPKYTAPKYTAVIDTKDPRAANIVNTRNGKTIARAAFVANAPFPPNQRHLLLGGFTSVKRMKMLCQDNGILLFFYTSEFLAFPSDVKLRS